MYSFRNDYSEGAHEKILQALIQTNKEQTPGYGTDIYTTRAIQVLKKELDMEEVDIHFIPGGTQTNLIAISSFLRPYEAVISATTGHINVHETGAIEATGHKVLTAYSEDGKLTKESILPILKEHDNLHMVKPGMVYISNATELGTIYNKAELTILSEFCKEQGLILYMDGARLGCALCAKENDLTIKDITNLTDCFYIGGTKNGAFMGEALVVVRDDLKMNLGYSVKQRGGLTAKGRILGISFLTLFENGLFYELAYHANVMAERLREGIISAGYTMLSQSVTNQMFPIFPNELIEAMDGNYDFEIQKEIDEVHTCIRFVTSWATDSEAVDQFIIFLNKRSKIR